MAKLWQVDIVHPLKLWPHGPVEARDDLLVVPMDPRPRGELERMRPDSVAGIVPRGRKVLLQVGVQGRYVQLERTPVAVGRAKPEAIVYAPTGQGDLWDAFLVVPEAKRKVDRPIDVDRHYWQSHVADQVRNGADAKPPARHWATAWSIYCAHIAPGSPHCRKPSGWYLTGEEELPIDFWEQFAELAREAGYDIFLDRENGEATIEAYAELKLDQRTGLLTINGKARRVADARQAWQLAASEVRAVQEAAPPPDVFATMLGSVVRALNAENRKPVHEPVSLKRRGIPGVRDRAFLVALGHLYDARPQPVVGGYVLRFEPATLAKDTVRIYSKRMRDYRRLGFVRLDAP